MVPAVKQAFRLFLIPLAINSFLTGWKAMALLDVAPPAVSSSVFLNVGRLSIFFGLNSAHR